MQYSIKTLDKCSEAASEINLLSKECWPDFLLHGCVPGWRSLFEIFSDFQILFFDQGDELIAVGQTIPLTWNESEDDLPENLGAIIERAVYNKTHGIVCNALSALAAMVRPEHRGQGLSRKIIEAMIGLGSEHECRHLLAPLRPPMKSLYPLTPFEHFIKWKRDDGRPFDPWIGVHTGMGAKMLKIMEVSLQIKASVAEWEEWTQMKFPESGRYIVKGAFQPVEINKEENRGFYEEPNIWVCHDIGR